MTHQDGVTDAEPGQYDRLLKGNARRIFSEPDSAKRLVALTELWAPDGELIESEGVVTGYEAISDNVGKLLAMLPPGTVFAPQGDAAGHHGVGRLRWRGVAADGAPGPVSGTDFAVIEGGLITKLYVILDPMA